MTETDQRSFNWPNISAWLCLAGSVAIGAPALAGCGARSTIELGEPMAVAAGGAQAGLDPATPARGGTASAGAPSTSGAGANTGGAAPCESVTVSIDDLRPAITIMVDQSRSMSSGFPDRNSPLSRWSLVGQALFDPTQGVVKTFEDRVRFGIAFFTGHRQACPLLNEISAATGNYGALAALYQRLGPDGDTPTGEALEKIVSQLQAKPTQGPQSVVLVTDGDPDTCARPLADQGQPEALAAVQRAHDAGFDVYVLGISNGIASEKLQQIANAGKGKPIDLVWGVDPGAAQPYQASGSALGLTAQLGDILNRVPLCQVSLQRAVTRDEALVGHVTLDGQVLGYSDNNGFDLKDSRHLEIVGAACDALKSSGKKLSVRIACN